MPDEPWPSEPSPPPSDAPRRDVDDEWTTGTAQHAHDTLLGEPSFSTTTHEDAAHSHDASASWAATTQASDASMTTLTAGQLGALGGVITYTNPTATLPAAATATTATQPSSFFAPLPQPTTNQVMNQPSPWQQQQQQQAPWQQQQQQAPWQQQQQASMQAPWQQQQQAPWQQQQQASMQAPWYTANPSTDAPSASLATSLIVGAVSSGALLFCCYAVASRWLLPIFLPMLAIQDRARGAERGERARRETHQDARSSFGSTSAAQRGRSSIPVCLERRGSTASMRAGDRASHGEAEQGGGTVTIGAVERSELAQMQSTRELRGLVRRLLLELAEDEEELGGELDLPSADEVRMAAVDSRGRVRSIGTNDSPAKMLRAGALRSLLLTW